MKTFVEVFISAVILNQLLHFVGATDTFAQVLPVCMGLLWINFDSRLGRNDNRN